MRERLRYLVPLVFALLAFGTMALGKNSVERVTYHGWKDALVLSNGQVEVVIVPAIGRVMQFRFIGEQGPFFENRRLDGRAPQPESRQWLNFGGDKTWPAPQSAWPEITGRAWPPPKAFDSMPVTPQVSEDWIELISAVDPSFGIRTVRRIELDPSRPVLTITTRYEKVEGAPSTVAVWVITQLNDPEVIRIPLPSKPRFEKGYDQQSPAVPPSLKIADGILELHRDRKRSFKIGTDAESIVWTGQGTRLEIKTRRRAGMEYTDHGSSAEVYTNPDPLPYVELELLGPLKTLKVGDKLENSNTYVLTRTSR